MAELSEAVKEHTALTKEWGKGAKMDRPKVAQHLEKLKLMLTKLSFLPTKSEEANIQVVIAVMSIPVCSIAKEEWCTFRHSLSPQYRFIKVCIDWIFKELALGVNF